MENHEDRAENYERNDREQQVFGNSDALGQPRGHSFGDVAAGPMQNDLRKHPPNGERRHELDDGATEQRRPPVYSTTTRT